MRVAGLNFKADPQRSWISTETEASTKGNYVKQKQEPGPNNWQALTGFHEMFRECLYLKAMRYRFIFIGCQK